MSKMRKLLAMFLALAMVLGMSITTMAAKDPTAGYPSNADFETIKATNILEDNVTVNAYKIVEPIYVTDSATEKGGITGYRWTCGLDKDVFNNEGKLDLTVQDLATLANNPTAAGLTAIPMGKVSTGTYEAANVGVGTYMILVTGSNNTVYNPMIASIWYTVNGQIDTRIVDATTSWDITTQDAYAKSSLPDIDKKIVGGDDGAKGEDHAFGEVINFKLDGMVIPSYSKQYTGTVRYEIVDELSAGLSFVNPSNVVVTVGGEPVVAGETTYTVSGTNTQKMTIAFASEYIKANGLKQVEVTYSAKMDEDATVNFAANTNSVHLEYTNSPTDTDASGRTEEKTTNHYTFALENEIVKVDSKDNTQKLSGAVFKLTRTDAPKGYTGKTVYESLASDTNGLVKFTGLDEGTYTLVETKAPAGYKVDETPHTVVIKADYDEATGVLTSYTVTVDEKTSTYTNDGSSELNAALIQNTTLASLPSTGGIGTTIFTVAGCGIMIAAAYLFFNSRRREEA